MKLSNLKALVIVSSLFAAPVFAADIDYTTLDVTVPMDVTTVSDIASESLQTMAVGTGPTDTQDVALIVQNNVADLGSVAWIDQDSANGGLNMAMIIQADTAAVVTVGVISQAGTGGFAFINQH